MNPYEQLQAVLDTHPARAPKTDSFMEILQILFTPEEAALAATMNFKAKSPDMIAKAAGLDEAAAQRLLETMADKAIIYAKKRTGRNSTAWCPRFPAFSSSLHEGRRHADA